MGIQESAVPLATASLPNTLVRDYRHWAIHIRRQQVTLGSLVLACKDAAPTMASLSVPALQELKQVLGETEATLASLFAYDKINYLVLMMVDPQVHFHVIPRYQTPRRFAGMDFKDASWPMPPDTLQVEETPGEVLNLLRDRLCDSWGQNLEQHPIGE